MSTPDLLLQWSIAAVVAWVLLARRQLTLFHAPTLYLGFHALAFCLRPTLLHVLGSEGAWSQLGLPRDPEAARCALWVSSTALVAFTLAYLAVTRRAARLRPAAPVELGSGERRALLIVLGIMLVPAGLATYAVRSTSQPSVLLADVPALALAPAAVLILTSRWRWWSLLPLGGWIAGRQGLALTDADIALALASALLVLLLALWTWGRTWPALPLLAVGALAAVAMFATDWRGVAAQWGSRREAPPAAAKELVWITHLQHPYLGYTEAVAALTVVVPAKTGVHTLGSQHLGWLLDAPETAATRQGTTRGLLNRHANLRRVPLPLVAEGWMSGGWAGVVITFACAGALLGAVFLWFSRRQDDPGAAALLAITQAWSLPWFTHGGEAILRIVPLAFASVLVWKLLERRFRRTAEAARERERLREERHQRRLIGHAMLTTEAREGSHGAMGAGPASAEPPEPPLPGPPAPPRWRSPPPP